MEKSIVQEVEAQKFAVNAQKTVKERATIQIMAKSFSDAVFSVL
jgi:hypothetical protein